MGGGCRLEIQWMSVPIVKLKKRELEVLQCMADGLANKEIAAQLFISYETVRWYARQIYKKLEVSNRAQAVATAHENGWLGEGSATYEPKERQVTLPNFTNPFIGRKDDFQQIVTRLNDDAVRLLTITGSGGIGKTRLGVEVARQQASEFPDGVYYIPMNDPQVVLESFSETLHRILQLETVLRSDGLATLAERKMLLMFDNFEQSVEQNEQVARLLDTTSNLKILITSQVPVNLQQEWLYQINGLSIGDPSEADSDAFDLFVARAQQVDYRFDSSAESDTIQKLCIVLKGYPLAIELAATWVRSLSCSEILEEVQQSMDLLSSSAPDLPERHRSIRAVFEHSWQLLNADQQRAMRRLAVFPTVFGVDAAMQVSDISVQDLASLIDRSLIIKQTVGLYQLHDLVRQYAIEKLQERESRAPKSNAALAMHALIRGEVDRVSELADELMRNADDNYNLDKGFALALRSIMTGVEGNYQQSLQLGQSSVPLTQELQLATFFTLLGLSISSIGLNDITSATRYIKRALSLAKTLRIPILRNLCLPVRAFVVAEEGQYTHAVTICGYIGQETSNIPDWLRQWKAYIQLESDLRATLDKNDFKLAWQASYTASIDELL